MNNLRIARDQYLERLIEFKDKPVIKAIVGIRRCGKSTLLGMYRDYLVSEGIDADNIISMNFTHVPYKDMAVEDVRREIGGRSGRMYILLDEVQMLEGWDSMVLDMFENLDCDICITGSNSVMFSSELSTLLSGRAVTIEMFPFSYEEFLRFSKLDDSDDALMEYMTYGGFPLALMVRESKSAEIAVLEDIYSTVVLKDIVMRKNLRNKQMLERIASFMMRNIGSPVSVKGIKDYMSSAGLKVNFETVDDYMKYLEESLTFYRAKRYNIKTKEELVVNDRFYLSDLGIRTAVLGRRGADIGHLMENLVYLELRRRGFTIYAGKLDDTEVDFVAMDDTKKLYVQVCYSLRDPDTEAREVRPLKAIKDDYRKIIVVMEKSLNSDRDGITEIGLREFLLGCGI